MTQEPHHPNTLTVFRPPAGHSCNLLILQENFPPKRLSGGSDARFELALFFQVLFQNPANPLAAWLSGTSPHSLLSESLKPDFR